MRFDDFFPIAAAGIMLVAVSASDHAHAETFSVAPTPIYGAAESQSAIHYRGPGLPGGEAQQTVAVGSRHPLFDVAGYDGVIYAPVAPPYDAAATYTTYAGQPGRGTTNVMALSTDGAP